MSFAKNIGNKYGKKKFSKKSWMLVKALQNKQTKKYYIKVQKQQEK